MRVDEDYRLFRRHTDWYFYVYGVGYVPTEEAPAEAVRAMRNYNRRTRWAYGRGTMETFKVRYVSEKPSIFFKRGEIYDAYVPLGDSRGTFFAFYLEDMDEPGDYALPADRFEIVPEEIAEQERYTAICEKIRWNPMTDGYPYPIADHEDDSQPSPFRDLSDEELTFLYNYLIKHRSEMRSDRENMTDKCM